MTASLQPPAAPAPRLQLAGITKAYPAVVANSDVALTVQPGEIHAVLGENGAGKSTLMKIIYGAVKPDAGSMQVDGRPVVIRNPQEARALGIAMVFQHFSLFDTLTVAENVWLGLDKSLSLAEVSRRIIATSQQYGLQLEPTRPVHTLAVGERQRVEIARSLLTGPRLLILDEPTSTLSAREAGVVHPLYGLSPGVKGFDGDPDLKLVFPNFKVIFNQRSIAHYLLMTGVDKIELFPVFQ